MRQCQFSIGWNILAARADASLRSSFCSPTEMHFPPTLNKLNHLPQGRVVCGVRRDAVLGEGIRFSVRKSRSETSEQLHDSESTVHIFFSR